MKKNIYLDYNVLLYYLNNKTIKNVLIKDLILFLKNDKEYIFPYSPAHMEELANYIRHLENEIITNKMKNKVKKISEKISELSDNSTLQNNCIIWPFIS